MISPQLNHLYNKQELETSIENLINSLTICTASKGTIANKVNKITRVDYNKNLMPNTNLAVLLCPQLPESFCSQGPKAILPCTGDNVVLCLVSFFVQGSE